MSKQKNILNFFKPVASKRNLSIEDEGCNKKVKVSEASKENVTINDEGCNKQVKVSEASKGNITINDEGCNKQVKVTEASKGNVTINDEGCNKQVKVSEEKANISEISGIARLNALAKELPILDPKMGESWFYALEKEFSKPYFKNLNNFIESERKEHSVYPAAANIWAWTKPCSVSQVKVVIIGQDPYHNPRQAHGLCFSVPKGVQPPPSLINIFKELESDIDGFEMPSHGDLTGWAKQGVLLLNSCLTVRAYYPNSHANHGWENITNAVIKHISNKNKGVVFLLWGVFAHKKANCVDQRKHHLLKTVHPSPLSAQRGFFGCKHFSKCNKLLLEEGKQPIDWKKLP